MNDPETVEIATSLSQKAGPAATTLNGTDEKTWDAAAVYDLQIPSTTQGRRLLLDLHYIGDAARLYVGDKLYDDNFYNGDPFSVALWRIPAEQWPNLKLKVLPYSDGYIRAFRSRAATPSTKRKTMARWIGSPSLRKTSWNSG